MQPRPRAARRRERRRGERVHGQHQPRRPRREPDQGPRAAAHAERHRRLQAAPRRQHAAEGRPTGEWADKPNYFDVTVWGNQGESCAQYLAKGRPVGDRRPPRVARVGGPGRHQAPGRRDHRRERPVPRQPRRRRGRRRSRSSSPPARAGRPTPTSRRPQPTTTSRSDGAANGTAKQREERSTARRRPAARTARRAGATATSAATRSRRSTTKPQPAPALHLGEGQDPLAADHRRLPPPPGAGRGRGQAGARDGAAPLRRGG